MHICLFAPVFKKRPLISFWCCYQGSVGVALISARFCWVGWYIYLQHVQSFCSTNICEKMIQALQLDDPIVSVEDIKKFKLAFLMQFFVQHKQRFRFPRLRLQDLYQHILKGSETVPLCDCVARILRFLRHRDPTVCIAGVDGALDAFVGEKRTTHRQALQAARAGRSVSELDPPARALLLEHLIECVYDERPDLSFNAVLNAPKANAERDVGVLASPDDESLLIKVGQDASGSSYYYMDDLRLYRETPQGGFSSHWSVAVGPTIQQWTSFIASLGRAGEEAELCHFLKKDLFSYVQECIENPYMSDFADELNSARLLDKEAVELAEIRQQRGLPVVPTSLPSVKSSTSPSSQVAAPLATEGVTGSSAASSSGNSTSTCPLTPPNETPSVLPGVSQASQPTASTPESSAAPMKASLTAPNTPSTGVWIPDSSHPSSSTLVGGSTRATHFQHPNSVEPPHSVYSLCSSSPSQQHIKLTNEPVSGQQHLLDSPIRRPASGPMPAEVAHQADGGQPHSAPPFSAPSSVGDGHRRTSIVSNQTFPMSGQKLDDVPEGVVDAVPTSNIGVSSSAPSLSGSAPQPTAAVSGPLMLPPHALVFTTEMANEAAAKCQRARMRITTFHSIHPLVQQFMLQSGLIPAGNSSAIGGSSANCAVTQEQLENRKSKMAQLEKIHSKLTKSKMASTPGAATVAAMQQQQMYAAAAGNGGQLSQPLAPPLPPPGAAIPPIQHDPLHLPPHPTEGISAGLNQQPRGLMVVRPEERDFDRTSWLQQQRKHPGSMGDPNGARFQYSGSMDHMVVPPPPPSGGGPPVLVVPPNNACGYPPPPNKFCVPAPPPPPYKRPYPPDMTPPEQQFWDQQHAMFEQQQAMLMQQQQTVATTPVNCGRPTSGRGGLSKKRKSASGTVGRSASARPPQLPSMSPFSSPQRLPQPQPPVSMIKSGGFGSVPIGPLRNSAPGGSYQAIPSDPLNGAYVNPSYRGSAIASGNPSTVIEQPQYPPVPPGSTSTSLPPTTQQQLSTSGYSHPVDSVPLSSPTQHLTSASLASLARLSQLSGSEGPFCPPPPAVSTNPAPSCPPPSSGYSRMASAPDILAFSGGGGPAMIANPDSDPSSLYSIGSAPTNSSTGGGGPSYQAVAIPPGSQQISPQQHFSTGPSQPVGAVRPLDQVQPPGPGGSFTPSDQPRSAVDPSPSASRCLTPTSAPPICPTSVSPTTSATVNSMPPASAAVSQSASQQPLPPPQSIQVNNTFFNAQLNVQQMNYQHINGGCSSAQMQIQFVQQHPYYGSNGCPVSHPPPNQRIESRTPQPPSNVQIMPKTPHTIQYLPTSSAPVIPTSSATSGASTPPMTSTNTISVVGGQYPPQPVSLGVNGKPRISQSAASTVPPTVSRIQSPTHSQVAPNAVATSSTAPSANPSTVGVNVATSTSVTPEHRATTISPRQQQQREQKTDHSQTHPAQLPMTNMAQGSMAISSTGGAIHSGEMTALPYGMYVGSGVATTQKYPQGFPVSLVDVPQAHQLDSINPFDFPQGATTYSVSASNANAQSRGPYREQLHIQYASPACSSTSVTYRVDAELPSSAPAPAAPTSSSAVTCTTTATKKFLPSSSQMYMGDMTYQQQRWQQQQQVQVMAGGDFYVQQSQNSTSGSSSDVMMMPPTATMQASQAQQQYYMPPPVGVPSHLHQQLQPQPPSHASHSRAYPALL
ncbi:conserved hypothetical protein [Echinococcus multilocularis]|uniref:Uncharacterized protein n=1 Tax=Echinococcus multilocularis TaxID=6211 RepID=A0A068Y8G1_ECHMU|nr:conserved hypothetical protein [Echinococcus multilocularis]